MSSLMSRSPSAPCIALAGTLPGQVARSSTARARAATLSPVKPKCSYSTLAGAEAPKPSMATTSPCSPTQRCQPSGLAASTATRARTAAGSTPARRQHAVAVGLVLLGEAVQAGHAHKPHLHALGGEDLERVVGDVDL